MKKFCQIISGVGAVVLFIISIFTTKNPFEWFEGISMMSSGYPKFMITWVGYCMIYLGIIWIVYYILDKILYKMQVKRLIK